MYGINGIVIGISENCQCSSMGLRKFNDLWLAIHQMVIRKIILYSNDITLHHSLLKTLVAGYEA